MASDLCSRPDPAASFEDAVGRIASARRADASSELVREGESIALLTGARTPRAVVLFHGYTSMPGQFRLIAEAYRAAGHNVWVPRMPFHGYADRLTIYLSGLTAGRLRDHSDRAMDVAAGLGDEVTVVGLSGGGSIATWCAVERPEVTEAFVDSPLMQPQGVPVWATRVLVGSLPSLPFDKYDWWYPKLKDRMPGYGYPRFSYRGIASLLALVYHTQAVAKDRPLPVQGRYTLVRNDGDDRLDSAFNERVARSLVPADRLSVYRIPATEGLVHDIVTPEETGENAARIDLAYHHLAEALGVELPAPSTLFARS